MQDLDLNCCLRQNSINEFKKGYFPITTEGPQDANQGIDTGIDFGIYNFNEGEVFDKADTKETVWVLMNGSVDIQFGNTSESIKRESIFDEPPTAIHLPANENLKMTIRSHDAEFALAKCENSKSFSPKLFKPEDLTPEYRGEGLVQGACLRNVRLIFDLNHRSDSNLVIGEVINYPGKWSSYPPHHHDQPEIYHYRFTKDQGYGHAELGEHVLKVKHGNTLKIPGGLDHSQVSAPGYGMYYLWIVRHLDGNPYKGFTYSPEHEWTLSPQEQGWQPSGVPGSTASEKTP